MTLSLPDWLPPTVVTCVAGHFPTGDEDAMRRAADVWSDKADWCREQAEYHEGRARSPGDGQGDTVTAVARKHQDLADRFRDQATYCDKLAEQLYEGANSIELQKMVVIGTALVLATTLARCAMMFAAGGAVQAGMAQTAARASVQTAWQKFVAFLTGRGAQLAAERSAFTLIRNGVLIGVLQGGGINAVAQGIQIAEDHRDSMDWKSAGVAAAAGGVGGGLGAVVGHRLGPKVAGFGADAGSKGRRVALQLAGTALVGGAGGAAGAIGGTAVSLLLTDQAFTRKAFTEGLIPGFAGGFLGAAGYAAQGLRGSAPVPAESPKPASPPAAAGSPRSLVDALARHGIVTADFDPSNPSPAHHQQQIDHLMTMLRQPGPGGAAPNRASAQPVSTQAAEARGATTPAETPLQNALAAHLDNAAAHSRTAQPVAAGDRPAPAMSGAARGGDSHLLAETGSTPARSGTEGPSRAPVARGAQAADSAVGAAVRGHGHPEVSGDRTGSATGPQHATDAGPPRVSAPKGAVTERPPALDVAEPGRGAAEHTGNAHGGDEHGRGAAPRTREREPEHGAADEGHAAARPPKSTAEPDPAGAGAARPHPPHESESGRAEGDDGPPRNPAGRDDADHAHATHDSEPGRAHGVPEDPAAGDDGTTADALAAKYRSDADDLLTEYESRDWSTVSEQDLTAMLHGGDDHDAALAVIEVISREEGKTLRWTQVMAMLAMRDGVVNMDAGEGKTLVFLAAAALDSARSGPAQVITTRDTLANHAFDQYRKILGKYGYDIVRMNPDRPYAAPDENRATIYVGTMNDAGFGRLRGNVTPGRHVSVDEIDEALVHANTTFILSEGTGSPAGREVTGQVTDAHGFLEGALRKRSPTESPLLSEADFGRRPGQIGGSTALTEGGRAKVREILGRDLTDAEAHRLTMAATAKWEYVENDHYVVWHHPELGPEFHTNADGTQVRNPDSHKIYILDPTSHKVMYDPETSTESRWNGGLAQAIEAKHGIAVRDDPGGTTSVTAKELVSRDNVDKLSGASGTAKGVAAELRDNGVDQVVEVPRFKPSQLQVAEDHVATNQVAKIKAMADSIADRQSSGRPQLAICNRNSEVAQLSAELTAQGVDHVAVDAKWFLAHGKDAEADLQTIFDEAGKQGKVLVINRQGGRGVDIPVGADVDARGGLHVLISSRSAESRDVDIQAENRTARSGGQGSAQYFTAPDDPLYHDVPEARITVIRYTGAAAEHETALAAHRTALAEHQAAPTADARARLDAATTDLAAARGKLAVAEDEMRGLVSDLQPLGVRRPSTFDPAMAHLANGPPATGAAPTDPATQQPQHPPPIPTDTAATDIDNHKTRFPATDSEPADAHTAQSSEWTAPQADSKVAVDADDHSPPTMRRPGTLHMSAPGPDSVDDASAQPTPAAPDFAAHADPGIGRAVAAQIFTTFGVEVLGLDKPGISVDTALAVRNAIADAIAEDPAARPAAVVVTPMGDAFAAADAMLGERQPILFLSEEWLARPEAFAQRTEYDFRTGFKAAPTGNPVYDTLRHELAHLRDLAELLSHHAPPLAATRYRELRRRRNEGTLSPDGRFDRQRDYRDQLAPRAFGYLHEYFVGMRRQGDLPSDAAFDEWLDRLDGYSFRHRSHESRTATSDGIPSRITEEMDPDSGWWGAERDFNAAEALAEANNSFGRSAPKDPTHPVHALRALLNGYSVTDALRKGPDATAFRPYRRGAVPAPTASAAGFAPDGVAATLARKWRGMTAAQRAEYRDGLEPELRHVRDGERRFVLDELAALVGPPSETTARRRPPLTKRQQTILSLVAQGKSNTEIAGQLGISASSVAHHVERINRKLGGSARSEPTLAVPAPAAYDTINEWLKVVRQHYGVGRAELAGAVEVSTDRVRRSESKNKPRLLYLRKVRDALNIPNDIFVAALRRFYSRPDIRVRNHAEEELFWRLIATRPGSTEEIEIRNKIVENYSWMPEVAAYGWRIRGEERDDLVSRIAEQILNATGNFVPPGCFGPIAWSHARYTLSRTYYANKYPFANAEELNKIIRVTAYSRNVTNRTGSEPSDAEIAAALGLTTATMAHVRDLMETGAPNTGMSENRSEREPAVPRGSALTDKRIKKALQAALADFQDPRQAAKIVELHFIEGYSPAEVAARLRIPVRTAEDLIERIRETLRRVLPRPDTEDTGDTAAAGSERRTAAHPPAPPIDLLTGAQIAADAARIGWFRALTDTTRNAIRSGALPPGTKLPPARLVAERLGLADEIQVGRAYRQLAAEGYVVGKRGVGTTVTAPVKWPAAPAATVDRPMTAAELIAVLAAASPREPLADSGARRGWRETVVSTLRRAIESRALPEGQLLPTAQELARQLGMSSGTSIGRAYRLLADEGYVAIHHGVGTVVAYPTTGERPRSRTERLLFDCVTRVAHNLNALGYTAARPPGGNNWQALRDAVDAELVAVELAAHGDPLAGLMDTVRTGRAGVDTAVVLVDDGTTMHSYLVTNAGGTVVVFDTNSRHGDQEIARVRTEDEWKQSFPHITRAFAAYFTDTGSGELEPIVPAEPSRENPRDGEITGPPDVAFPHLRAGIAAAYRQSANVSGLHPTSRILAGMNSRDFAAVADRMTFTERQVLLGVANAGHRGREITFLENNAIEKLLAALPTPPFDRTGTLTDLEYVELELVAADMSLREIGIALGSKDTTVRAHLRRVQQALGVDNRSAAVAAALSRGILARTDSGIARPRATPATPELTEREHQVLTLLAQGLTSAEIARALGGLAVDTVNAHVENIGDKLGTNSRAGMVATALRTGALPLAEPQPGATPTLNDREVQVLAQAALGKTSAQIATALGLTEQTVDSYASRARRKLGAGTRAGAVAIGIRAGLLPSTGPAAEPGHETDRVELTERERGVLDLIVAGKTNEEISASLGLTAQTVKTYVFELNKKLGTHHRAGLVAAALRTGTVPLSTVGEVPDYVRSCLAQTVRATSVLGYEAATVPRDGADTWDELEDSLHTHLTEISVPTGRDRENDDPLGHVIDKVADPDNEIDSTVVVIDDGATAHSYLVTNIDGAAVVFDTNLPTHYRPAPGRDEPRRIPRVRTREQWTQSFPHINRAFVLDFAYSDRTLVPRPGPRPTRTDHREHTIQGPPADHGRRDAATDVTAALQRSLPGAVRQILDLIDVELRGMDDTQRRAAVTRADLARLPGWVVARLAHEARAQELARETTTPAQRAAWQEKAERLDHELARILGLREPGTGWTAPASRDPLHELRKLSRREGTPAELRQLVDVATARLGLDDIAAAVEPVYRLSAAWPVAEQGDTAVAIAWELAMQSHAEGGEVPRISATTAGEPGRRRIRIEVADGNRTLPTRADDETGWPAVDLLDARTESWGWVLPHEGGRRVWFELFENADDDHADATPELLLDLHLPRGSVGAGAGAARRAVADRLERMGWQEDQDRYDLVMLVSDLVQNVDRHAGDSDAHVQVWRRGDVIRVGVRDRSRGLPKRQAESDFGAELSLDFLDDESDDWESGGLVAGTHGRMIGMMEELATAWGVDLERTGGKTVWLEVRTPAIESNAAARAGLTEREARVLRLVELGRTNREIAAELGLSEHTVRNHLARMARKLGTGDRHEMPAAAARLGAETLDAELTAREEQILRLLAQRLSNSDIADRLGLSIATVKTHLFHLAVKLGTGDRLVLGQIAERWGLDRTGPAAGRPAAPDYHGLSGRQIEVLRHALKGLSYKQIGDHLGISESAVKHLVERAGQVLGTRGRVATLAKVRSEGLLESGFAADPEESVPVAAVPFVDTSVPTENRADVPAYVSNCLVQTVRAAWADGYDNATIPTNPNAHTWNDLTTALHTHLHEI
ncbi:LuxR C-terminal-related transcriptional regulator, partial [Nocardia wallacei]|uniref:LuxR C-terminal-related transcriptional regulator n=1 Tax=Nocardia wallacei TaxID=480035 RepID=UPI002456F3BF